MMTEVLPVGVGRVPQWWMECTPHYILDLEEDEARMRLEEEMATYYQQMAAADDAGLIGPDGQPRLGPDGQPLWHSAGWGGRGPGGKFQIDPTLFGISESDPDYHSYLTGAKLPPGFLEKMQQMGASNGQIYNNLKQTDYGRYGRQAETPAFQPSWMKKKLRSTGMGNDIRHGKYDDSPNKHYHRRRVAEQEVSSTPASQPEPVAQPTTPEPVQETIQSSPYVEAQETAPTTSSDKPKMVRKVRKVRRVKKKKAPEVESAPEPSFTRAPMHHEDSAPGNESFDNGHYEEEEVSSNGEEANLSDLQAILAAKQAELARLKAQM